MFRGKSAINGEGQTGGAPPSTTSALLSRNRTERPRRGGTEAAAVRTMKGAEDGDEDNEH